MQLITDHEALREWVEARGGSPAAHVSNRGGEASGELDIHFPGVNDDDLEDIDWNSFFDIFERKHLALLDVSETPEDAPTLDFRFTSRFRPKEGLAEQAGTHG